MFPRGEKENVSAGGLQDEKEMITFTSIMIKLMTWNTVDVRHRYKTFGHAFTVEKKSSKSGV